MVRGFRFFAGGGEGFEGGFTDDLQEGLERVKRPGRGGSGESDAGGRDGEGVSLVADRSGGVGGEGVVVAHADFSPGIDALAGRNMDFAAGKCFNVEGEGFGGEQVACGMMGLQDNV